MIERATAIEFVRAAKNGRTGPVIMVCEIQSGETVELFCKFSAGCDQGETNLARETLAACLAADIGLPIPTPYFVEVSPELTATITDQDSKTRIGNSIRLAFRSTSAPNQFAAWTTGSTISAGLKHIAVATLFFDGIIQNPDRRDENPNCLIKGEEIRIIDHELAFATSLIIGWIPPWKLDGLSSLGLPGNHIFKKHLHGKDLDFRPIKAAWSNLRDEQIDAYIDTIPEEWSAALPEIKNGTKLIADARDNIDACIAEARRILACP